jgi:hypothetical protein
MKYPHHWSVGHVSDLAAIRHQQPQSVSAASVERPAEAQSGVDGELATSPWMGLHYLDEGW